MIRGLMVGIGLAIGLSYLGLYQRGHKLSPSVLPSLAAAAAQQPSQAEAPAPEPVENGNPARPEVIPPPSAPPPISDALAQVLDMADAGVDETVLLAFIRNSEENFGVGPDQIIFLRDLGVASSLITGMIRHDAHRNTAWQQITPEKIIPEKSQVEEVQAAIRRALATPVTPPTVALAAATPTHPAAPALFAPATAAPTTSDPATEQPGPVEEAALPISDQDEPLYPVRAPYPVKLTDTIMIFRAQPRTPNLVVIRMLP